MRKVTVLVVDDDPAIVGFLVDALESEGYHVLATVDGQAVPLARDMQPDVILLDLMMPGMDGMAVSQCLRSDPSTAAIPIIAMSAQQRLHATAALLPVDDRLAKPFDLATLYATVARWTTTWRGMRIRSCRSCSICCSPATMLAAKRRGRSRAMVL